MNSNRPVTNHTDPNYMPMANNPTSSAHSSVEFNQNQQQPDMQQHAPSQGGNSVAMVSAELHLVALKDSFKQAANSLTQLYKQSSQSYNVAYQQGRLDGYEDVLAWLVADQAALGGEMRHVSVQRFRQFVQDRIN